MADLIIDGVNQCMLCNRFIGGLSCDAFLLIPSEIYDNKHDHTKPFKGDNGIRFEPISNEKRPDSPQE